MTNPASIFDALTTDLSIKSWALHMGVDGKRKRYYLYISSDRDVLKDCNRMSVRVDLMGETCDSPEEAIEVGYRQFVSECQRRINRIQNQPKPIQKLEVKDLQRMSADELLKELGL